MPRKTMRCRMSSAMGSVGPPASMKRGVMGGASALAPPARLCPPAAAPAHGTHSSLWAASGDTPARGNNTRPRDAGRHRAWRVERTTKGCETRGGAARTREGERTARTRAAGGAPTHRLDIAPARGRVQWTAASVAAGTWEPPSMAAFTASLALLAPCYESAASQHVAPVRARGVVGAGH